MFTKVTVLMTPGEKELIFSYDMETSPYRNIKLKRKKNKIKNKTRKFLLKLAESQWRSTCQAYRYHQNQIISGGNFRMNGLDLPCLPWREISPGQVRWVQIIHSHDQTERRFRLIFPTRRPNNMTRTDRRSFSQHQPVVDVKVEKFSHRFKWKSTFPTVSEKLYLRQLWGPLISSKSAL